MKIENLIDLCRACLSPVEASESYNLFETPELYSKFQECTALTLEATSPNVLCPKCYTKVHDFQEFRDMCIESDKTLQNYFLDKVRCELDDEKPVIDLESATNTVMVENEELDSQYKVRRKKGRKIKDETDPLVVLDKGNPVEQLSELVNNGVLRRRPGRPRKQPKKFGVNEALTLLTSVSETEKQEVASKDTEEVVASETMCRKKGRPLKLEIITKKKPKSKVGSRLSKTYRKKNSRGKLKVEATSFKCDLCPKRFLSEHCLVAHKRSHDGLVPYPCTYDGCDKGFNRLHHLTRHLEVHESNNCKFACDQPGCLKEYKDKSNLVYHKRTNHNIGNEFDPHLEVHESNNCKFACDQPGCFREYKNKSVLVYHMRKIHNIRPEIEPQICEICGNFFKTAAILKEHRITHRDKMDLPYVCERVDCGRRFATKDRLKVHMMRHDGIRKYVCPHCGMRKTTSGELKAHINYHTLERTWTCKYCSKVFNRVGNLNMHVRTVHERAKDYPCRFCDRTFGKLYTRKCHEMTHTGEKPHQCAECGKRFLQMSALNTHRKLHLKQRKETSESLVSDELVEHITAQE